MEMKTMKPVYGPYVKAIQEASTTAPAVTIAAANFVDKLVFIAVESIRRSVGK